MPTAFKVHILSADQAFYEGEAVSLILPGCDGQFGIMAHRSDLVAAIVPGEMKCRLPDGSTLIAVVSEGLVRVENNDVLVLVDSLERPEEIDENRARRAADRAREALLQKRSREEYLKAEAELSRAMNRLKAVAHRK